MIEMMEFVDMDLKALIHFIKYIQGFEENHKYDEENKKDIQKTNRISRDKIKILNVLNPHCMERTAN